CESHWCLGQRGNANAVPVCNSKKVATREFLARVNARSELQRIFMRAAFRDRRDQSCVGTKACSAAPPWDKFRNCMKALRLLAAIIKCGDITEAIVRLVALWVAI